MEEDDPINAGPKSTDLLAAIRGLNERPMTPVNFFKYFEQLLDKKYENDVADIEAGIQPRPMSTFMLEFFT